MKTLKRCMNNGEKDNVILIDVDSENCNNVILIDVPENLKKKLRRSNRLEKNNSCPLRTYIYIDDDESPDSHGGSDFDNGASSSRRYDPLKLSKCKRTYSGRGTNNRYCFSIQSDSDSSDGEGPDCEFMEDFHGKLREQWEIASKRKANSSEPNLEVDKTSVCHGQCSGQADISSQFGYGHIDEKCETTPFNGSREEKEEDGLSSSLAIDAVNVESSIINEREKLKETDEYKIALEEEMLARQRALKIQAEEAQQLRRLQKRKKAETLRLLDMEKRQKQRVEEIRENQKKDEENMNLKELYRTEVRQELSKLEATCRDMASLLRGLGIQVGDGSSPLSDQVRSAYKRALLSFHPDRASGCDMRKKVEAEEKFKLISRMKDQLLC